MPHRRPLPCRRCHCGQPVRVDGVGRNALQGDVRFADALAAFGARIRFEDHAIIAEAPADGRLRAIDADMNHIPMPR